MGICKFCGEKAGLFSNKHKECEKKYESGKREIISIIEDALVSKGDFNQINSKIESISKSSYIKEEEKSDLLIQGFDKAVERFFEDGLISEEEEKTVSGFMKHFNLAQNDLNRGNSYMRIVQGTVLRDVMNGITPERIQVDTAIPFNLQKGEKLVWTFGNVELYEQRTRTHYEGRHSGVGLRIAKGVYYRTGGFRGHPVQTTEMTYMGSGLMGISNMHIYFAGTKSFRMKYDKIVSFEPFEDGIGIQKDGVTAKPQVFKNIDGWFCYNLVTNLSQL